ncbi:MAG: flagellar biosynthesis protein FlhB [Hyphomicrobiales bacterium]|nr:MAG: flagellar biosynthesis protein FlhB [Hyphomicrobiales bacterium]
MSDEAPEQASKTEDPSFKKLEDAHKKGDVVKSQEVTTWFTLAGSGLMFTMLAPGTSQALAESLKGLLANADLYEVGGPAFSAIFWQIAGAIILVSVIPMLVVAAFATAGNLVQHRPLVSVDPIKPKFSKVSPLSGFKRLFSKESLVNFVKGLVKLSVVSGVLWFVLAPEVDQAEVMITADVGLILQDFVDLGVKIFAAVLAVVTIIAIADYVYQRNRWWNRQKMTVQETRDEYKQMEGDPKVKGRIRAIRQERGRKRMMSAVPEATVVVTNPTHYAVALKYDRDMAAPVCVAKGADAIALKIREIATDNDVPIVENPPLARALYASVDVDDVIPTEHFKAVAQVIGYVMRLRDRSSWRRG